MNRNDEYIRYTGAEVPFAEKHDGMLRLVAGARHIQILRANRRHPEWAEGFGHTYNHAPNLMCWRGRFFCQWLSNPVSEHVGRSHTYLSVSDNGVTWSDPCILFPAHPIDPVAENGPGRDLYEKGSDYACMHQRMGFYAAPDGRLLALGYYGVSAEVVALPCVGVGLGRVVREIHHDGTFGDIHFLIMNRNGGYGSHNVLYPMFDTSSDTGFVAACRALLADRLVMQQMWEENRDCVEDVFALRDAGQAFNHYRLPDGTVVGLWKHALVSLSGDDGQTWQPVRKCPSLVMSGGKIWGQRTADDQFALFYNPVTDSCHRWPLAVVTSENGTDFDRMLCAMGDVGPQRYWGCWRDYGPQYVRGLECDAQAPDGNVWLTYSMNKEDIWVSRFQSPITGTVPYHVADRFDALSDSDPIPHWNLYSPKWASVSIVERPTPDQPCRKALRLRHRDPADWCRATRIFPESRSIRIRFELEARQNHFGHLDIDLKDGRGLTVFRMILDKDRALKLKHGNGFAPICLYGWGILQVELEADCYQKEVTVRVTMPDGTTVGQKGMRFFGNAETLERLEFRAGIRRNPPQYDQDPEFTEPLDLPESDEPLAQEAVYYLYGCETADCL